MSDSHLSLAAYVEAAAQLTAMPLPAERATAVTAVLARVAAFAADLAAFELDDDVEVAGVFTP